MDTAETIIRQTKKWITEVVIGCNFCPFAAGAVKTDGIRYQVRDGKDRASCLESFMQECVRLDEDPSVGTTLLIFPDAFPDLYDYLDLVSLAEKLLIKSGYEGVYQVASFHPLYQFAGSPAGDAANYTNRSPYPMLHLLREDMIEKALLHYTDPEKIPEKNISFARAKGAAYMKMLREACLK